MNKKTNFNTLCVVGAQWGDESKGAVTDYYANNWADIVVRSQGGNNAGHSITFNGERYAVRSLPSGIFNPKIVNIVAQGCVVDPIQMSKEIANLQEKGIVISPKNLMVSNKCHVIMDYHRMLDQVIEETRINPVKTTGNGIGPCYADKMYRLGIRLGEGNYGFDHLIERIQDAVTAHNLYVDDNYIDALANEFIEAYELIKPYIGDTATYLNSAIENGKKVLFEGAQAAMLDIDSAFYPYVTSSNPTTAGMAVGSGLAPKYFNNAIGVVKAYSTRVGAGPFVTEIRDKELASSIREIGHEYGTVTGRPRRIGWLDLNVLREAHRMNGFTELSVRLLDVLTGIDKIYICTGYYKQGGENELMLETFLPSDSDAFVNYIPNYITVEGWTEDITKCKTWEELPENARKYIETIEKYINVPVTMIGVGPDRDQTIIRK